MAKGLDIGTMYVVSSQNTEQGTVFRKQRNAFYTMNRDDFEDGFNGIGGLVSRESVTSCNYVTKIGFCECHGKRLLSSKEIQQNLNEDRLVSIF